MEYEIRCSVCGESSHEILNFRCSSCRKPLDVQLNFDFEAEKIRRKDYTLWRYVRFFPYVKTSEIITLGEGWTPLVKFSDHIYFKLENLNPTGSFKDRGSTVLLSTIHKPVKKAGGYIAEDSSGNAGASMAAYAACAGLKARIYVPKDVSGPKFNQIQFYDAEVVKVSGGRSKVAEQAQKTAKNKLYVGHILHPLFRDGLRSLAYEIAEQLDWHGSKRVYLPVSAGTLLLGVIKGFKHLFDSKVIPAMPEIVACQTKQVSPLYHRFEKLVYHPPNKASSIADALVSVNPPLLNLMVEQLRKLNGTVVIVDEDEIFSAFMELARRGFFVEPSSAVAWAAYKRQFASTKVSKDDESVIILTGSGLKSTLEPNWRSPRNSRLKP